MLASFSNLFRCAGLVSFLLGVELGALGSLLHQPVDLLLVQPVHPSLVTLLHHQVGLIDASRVGNASKQVSATHCVVD